MNDLFRKLNVLVRASVNELIGDEGPRKPLIHPDKLGQDADRQIKALRQAINEALDHEERLQTRVNDLQAEVENWDRQADDAVAQDDDVQARYAITQVQLAQQRLALAESDLRDHQMVTQELIQRVNQLEAAVADARQSAPEQAPQADTSAIDRVSGVLHDMQSRITELGEMISAKDAATTSQATEGEQDDSIADEVVDDDLARRRDRLSKR